MSQSKVKYSNIVFFILIPFNVFDIQSKDWIVNVIERKNWYLREIVQETFNSEIITVSINNSSKLSLITIEKLLNYSTGN